MRVAGQDRFAESVRHVSVDEGDGLGFAVLSYTPEGRERCIEVKTTRWSDRMPYLVSRNEVEFSAEESDSFVLICLFGFGRSRGGFFELPGALERSSALTPINFSAVPRGA
ncbi:DUF3883 domain-containing protein [Nocardioides daedukensis]|uniref:DUF3883 domain-containing protein n=1 Tax=Nocardioides daedukensis TaxID=634462 RepID=UPI003CCD1397